MSQDLSPHDVRLLHQSLASVYELRDQKDYAERVIGTVESLIPCDRASYNEVDYGTHHVNVGGSLPEEPQQALVSVLERHLDEHPAASHVLKTGYAGAVKISDFVSLSEFRGGALYDEFYRPLHTNHQLGVTLSVAPSCIVPIVVSRERGDFSERDRQVLDVLRPHLVQAQRNAQAVTKMHTQLRALEESACETGRGTVGVSPAGKILWATPQVLTWLHEYWPEERNAGEQLPEIVTNWVSQQHLHGSTPACLTIPRSTLVVTRERRRLMIRLFDDRDGAALLLEECATSLSAEDLAPLGLGRREAEVLIWVAEGKTNAEIGLILEISPKTVKKHLERIFEKLGVETRTAAAARALEVLRGERPHIATSLSKMQLSDP